MGDLDVDHHGHIAGTHGLSLMDNTAAKILGFEPFHKTRYTKGVGVMPWFMAFLLRFTDQEVFDGFMDTDEGRELVKILGSNSFYVIIERKNGQYSILPTRW